MMLMIFLIKLNSLKHIFKVAKVKNKCSYIVLDTLFRYRLPWLPVSCSTSTRPLEGSRDSQIAMSSQEVFTTVCLLKRLINKQLYCTFLYCFRPF